MFQMGNMYLLRSPDSRWVMSLDNLVKRSPKRTRSLKRNYTHLRLANHLSLKSLGATEMCRAKATVELSKAQLHAVVKTGHGGSVESLLNP